MKYSSLTVNVGGMFSGKTTELLRQGKRHMYAKDNVVYVKPSIDNRYAANKVTTHNGDYQTALVVPVDANLLDQAAIQHADVVLIDEVQFFEIEIIDQIRCLVNLGKKVYASGLDLSYENKPFYVTAMLMIYADVVTKFQAVCECCGSDAYITAKRPGGSADVIEIGSADKYIPLCRKCYFEKNIGGVVK